MFGRVAITILLQIPTSFAYERAKSNRHIVSYFISLNEAWLECIYRAAEHIIFLLDYISVVLFYGTVSLLSLPVGYLIVSQFIGRATRVPFMVLVPIFLAVGLTTQILFSFFAGLVAVSPIVPVVPVVTAVLVADLLILKFWRKDREDIKIPFRKLVNFGALSMIIIVFAFLAYFPAVLEWPPAGDAVIHSTYTSLAIYQNHIPTNLLPFREQTLAYPLGYHMFSANISLLLNINPGEAVFLLASYIVALIGLLLFSLTYILTRSFWLSAPIAFAIFIAHSSGLLVRWVLALLINGPYPNLYGFMALLSVVVTLQLAYSNKLPLYKMSSIMVVLVATLFITYPVFLPHALLIIVVYFACSIVSRKFRLFSYEDSPVVAGTKQRVRSTNGVRFSVKNVTMHLLLEDVGQFLHQIKGRINGRALMRPLFDHGILAISAIVIVSFAGGLFPYYAGMILPNIGYFQARSAQVYYASDTVLREYLSDSFYFALLLCSVGAAALLVIKGSGILEKWRKHTDPKTRATTHATKSRLVPLSILFILLLAIIAGASISLLSAQRSFVFIFLLSWPIIAYALYEVGLGGIRIRSRVLDFVVLSMFVLVLSQIMYPHIQSKLISPGSPGWFLNGAERYADTYQVSMWIKDNVPSNELILNDRSYSSFYLNGFKVQNMTHSYWSGHMEPMVQDLTAIWQSSPLPEDEVRDLLRQYDVKYILLTPETGYLDYPAWGGPGGYKWETHPTSYYKTLFDSYDFLILEYASGDAAVYSVRY